jgi:D-lactate dehydrogenase (cytochrome)
VIRSVGSSVADNDYSAYLEDAAHFPGGHAAGVVLPRTDADVADALRSDTAVLPIGAQSSLTGGATPMGEVILSTAKMTGVAIAPGRVEVGAGVTVAEMQERLAEAGAWFPPVPTFTGACAGGIVATNAAGAATFKYGSVRRWVEALTVVLADGTILDIRRGALVASQGRFEIDTRSGRVAFAVPSYRMPNAAKCSAGYHAAPDMDLIDLFIGSEGTLGVITRVTFRTVTPAPNIVLAMVPCPDEASAVALTGGLREASIETWRARSASGIDAAAIEHIDHRSLEIVREDGADRRNNVTFPAISRIALLVQLELDPTVDAARAFDEIQEASDAVSGGTGLAAFCRELERFGVLADAEIALPHDARRIGELLAVREAVPAGVNQRIGQAKRSVDARIEKTAADMIVPFDRLAEMMAIYRRGFEARGLDYAIWGHISDGNVHPNVIARSFDDVEQGKAAILEFGREVARLGGCPLAEHGVGRNPVKQALLRQLYGEHGLEEMRAVKRALDPRWRLSPGVIFPKVSKEP